MTPVSLEQPQRPAGLDWTGGFLVADARGRGSSLFDSRSRLVRADAIETIDAGTRIVGLRVDRAAIRAFL